MVQELFDNKRILALLFFACLTIGASCRPSIDVTTEPEESTKRLVDPSDYPGNLPPETILKVQQCEMNQSTMELCMRCAKVTKSETIYPMCCNNDDGVKDWCNEYVYFGRDENF